MPTGTWRAFLWVLGGLGVLWTLLSLLLLPPLWRWMGEEAALGGRATLTLGGGTMAALAFLLILQFLVMLSLVGLFLYLLVNSLRAPPTRASNRT